MVKEEKKLRILAAGDIHGDLDIAKRLASRAKREKVDLVVLAGDIHGVLAEGDDVIEPFKKARQKVVFVPGNWDTSLEAQLIRDKHGIKNVDGYYVTYGGVGIAGVGNPDFKLSLDDEKVFKSVEANFKKMKGRKKILVSHLHAAGTKSEFSGWSGNKGLRKAIDKLEPDVFISGHIHEAEGIEEKIGKTKVISVGRKGKIIEV